MNFSEPLPLGTVLSRSLADQGESLALAVARARWAQVVGATQAQQSVVLRAGRGRLEVGVGHEASRQRFLRSRAYYQRAFGALPDKTALRALSFTVIDEAAIRAGALPPPQADPPSPPRPRAAPPAATVNQRRALEQLAGPECADLVALFASWMRHTAARGERP